MKHFLYIAILIFFISFAGCKTFDNKLDISDIITTELSKIENIENYSDETIKTISVIINNQNITESSKEIPIIKNDKIKNLVNETLSKKLNKKLILNTSNENWSEKINKYEILEFLKNKNIEPSNLSNIEIKKENDFAKTFSLNNIDIDFLEFANYFKLKSNNNISFINENNFIIFNGYGNTFNFNCDIMKIESLSNQGLNFNEILDKIT